MIMIMTTIIGLLPHHRMYTEGLKDEKREIANKEKGLYFKNAG